MESGIARRWRSEESNQGVGEKRRRRRESVWAGREVFGCSSFFSARVLTLFSWRVDQG
jgi:hypothetical protein